MTASRPTDRPELAKWSLLADAPVTGGQVGSCTSTQLRRHVGPEIQPSCPGPATCHTGAASTLRKGTVHPPIGDHEGGQMQVSWIDSSLSGTHSPGRTTLRAHAGPAPRPDEHPEAAGGWHCPWFLQERVLGLSAGGQGTGHPE